MFSLKLAVVGAFVLSALVCTAAALRARRLADGDLRVGLTGVFVLTAVWSVMEAVRLFTPVDRTIAHVGYLGGLVVGLAAVGAWLYFCSAYAGLSYHRDRQYLATGAVAYLAAVSIKLTNPVHGGYYTVQLRDVPFSYFSVNPGPAHWVLTAAVYLVVARGFVALFSSFQRARADTTGLWILSLAAAVPVLPEVAAAVTTGTLPGLNYEPLGVALFGIGALFVVEDRFLAVGALARQQVVDDIESAVLIVNRERRLLDFNEAAMSLFPKVDGGRRIGECSPALAEQLAAHRDQMATDGGSPVGLTATATDSLDTDDLDDGSVLTVTHAERVRHYLCRVVDVELGSKTLGWGMVLSEVTELEEKRRTLRKQNQQLDDFATGIAHELRNPLSVVQGYAELLGEAVEDDLDQATVERAVSEITEATERMTTAVDEMNMLARRGRIVEETSVNRVSDALRTAQANLDGTIETVVETDGVVVSDEIRLWQILRNVLRFADTEESRLARISVRDQSVLVGLDGCLDIDETRRLLRHGYAGGQGDTRLALANARAMARAHGWSVSLEIADPDTPDSVVFVFEHVDATPDTGSTADQAPGDGVDSSPGTVDDPSVESTPTSEN
jgi:Bacteriophytochrome (light-regulated signal transduction histidine kinase)